MTRIEELKRAWPKGSSPPYSYVAWHEWAEAQHEHGLQQTQCTECWHWRFPQELPCTHVQSRAAGRVTARTIPE